MSNIEILEEWSKEVKKIFDNRCAICGSAKDLEAHHIYPKSKYPQIALDIRNGVCLCRKCHRTGAMAYHKKYGMFGNVKSIIFFTIVKKIILSSIIAVISMVLIPLIFLYLKE